MADVMVIDGGSIVLLQPETDAGLEWIEENIGQDNGYQPYWPIVVCERRYVGEILDGIASNGLVWAGETGDDNISSMID